MVNNSQDVTFNGYVKPGTDAFQTTLTSQTTTLTRAEVGAVEATYGGYHVSIIASIVAIVIIVLIMVIIYLILRYRRKKKMKKKLQYLKLLEE
ncbi:rifin, fragment [Plasmodium reichenowi]|uniref:Rifin n=1 Tax=Plasmodium reichenowi TaxID=5854 RepID=A0A2P9D5Q2_PLARE|nr:rifin, fragment [Plasmodium reichenowi]